MTTNVPPVEFTDVGFVAPQASAVLAGVQLDINAAFGGALNYNLNTPQGQLASSEAAVIDNCYATFTYFAQQVDPAYAVGRFQDAIARIYFLERNPAEATTLQVACTGLAGVVIPVGATIVDTSDVIYGATDALTIPAGGTVTGSFAAIIPGPTTVPLAGAVSIYQAIPGWDTVSVVSGVVGVDTETRSSFEQRRLDSVEGNSFGAIGSIIGAVADVPGVTDYFGYDNGEATPVTIFGVAIAANTIYIAVSGGAQSDIAQAILSKKAPGCGYTGNTTVTAYDDNPLYGTPIPYTVMFTIPTPLQLLFAVNIVPGPSVPSNAATQIQAAVIAAVTTGLGGPRARIGSTVRATTYIPAIAALGPWAQVSAISVGSSNTASSVFVGSIAGTTLTVTSVTSGAIAAGQTLSDAAGNIPAGTVIISGAGTSWVINNPLTVPSETISGSLANQSSVQVQADQEPQVSATNIAVTVT